MNTGEFLLTKISSASVLPCAIAVTSFVSTPPVSTAVIIDSPLLTAINPTNYTSAISNSSAVINYFWPEIPLNNQDYKRMIERLDFIASLTENWNENGAHAFSPRIIENAKKFVKRLTVTPIILPTARGSIQFEYENTNGDYLEFELFEDERLKQFSFSKENKSKTIFTTFECASKAVAEFYGI